MPADPSSSSVAGTLIQAGVAAAKPRYTDIDPERLRRFIASQLPDGTAVTLSNIRGGGANAGASSGIVVFDAAIDGETRGYVLRYAPMDNEKRLFLDYRIAEQCALQHGLHGAGLPVPDADWVDPQGAVLGFPGFIMERLDGEVAHGSPFASGPLAEASAEGRAETIGSILDVLGRIHGADWRVIGAEAHVCRAEGRTPLERYLNWFWKTAEWVAEPAALARLDRVRQWLFANQPVHHPDDHALVHGDPSLGNYMLQDGRAIAAIDWELAGIVHPTYDVAMQCLANDYYRASSADLAPIIPSDADWVADYKARTGRRATDFDFYRKAATIPLLTVHLSMRRSMPTDMQAPHAELMEASWAVAERV